MNFRSGLLALITILALGTAPTLAEGNLAAKGVYLPDLVIDTDALTFSQNEYDLETGVYYHLNITADDADNLAIVAPELWRNSWIDQIVVNDLEVKVGGLYSLEFDGAGTFNVTFVPIRPGVYEFYAPGYQSRGLKGKFIVK